MVGDLVRTPRGNWATSAPTHCANGHWLGPNRVTVGYQACRGQHAGGHTSWFCLECGDVTYGPPPSADCDIATGPDER